MSMRKLIGEKKGIIDILNEVRPWETICKELMHFL